LNIISKAIVLSGVIAGLALLAPAAFAQEEPTSAAEKDALAAVAKLAETSEAAKCPNATLAIPNITCGSNASRGWLSLCAYEQGH